MGAIGVLGWDMWPSNCRDVRQSAQMMHHVTNHPTGRPNDVYTQKKETGMIIVDSLLASLHHIAAFTMVACLGYEWVGFRQRLMGYEVRRIQQVDLWYGISAGVLLVAGLLRVFFEKGVNFYVGNPLFWVKMTLVTVVGVISIYPTVRYIKWGKHADDDVLVIPDDEHQRIRLLLNVQLIGIGLILLAAPAMARAIGLYWFR